MKKYTEFIVNITVILCATIMIAILPTDKDAAIYEDTLRLHILASSDSDEDQGLKYEIRDKLLKKYGEQLKSASSIKEAANEVSTLIDDIERDVNIWIEEAGYSYGCAVAIGTEWYGTREYENFTLPKGYYTSLCIKLGEAEGQNWWCVMYPPLCLDIATESSPADDFIPGYSNEEYTLITKDGYNIKFKMLELISSAFSKK